MQEVLQKSVFRLLRPLARLVLRHGVSHAEFADWAKQAFVREAEENFGVGGKKTTVSRIATVTGINRKEVKRIQELPAEISTLSSKHNRAARVVTGWLQDTDFQDETGQPKPLGYGDTDQLFNQLVKRYSGDVPARAILDELIRVGTVSRDQESDLITLQRKGYVPHESKEDMLTLFGDSSVDLLTTLDHNISSGADESRLQLSVVYDNISDESLRKFKALSRDKASNLLKELDKFLSSQDRDLNPDVKGKGRYRAGLGLYLIEDEQPADEQKDD